MVEAIKSLLPTKRLKTNLLKKHEAGVHVFYDGEADELLIQIVPPERETIVHYIEDRNVALLYEARTREIVGLQIEGFQNSFLQKHDTLSKVWTKTVQVKDFGELMLIFQKIQPVIAKEVVKASHQIIEQKNEGLADLLTERFAKTESYASAYNWE